MIYQIFRLRSIHMYHMLYCFCRLLRRGSLNTMVINLKLLLRRMNSKHSSNQWPLIIQKKLISLKLPAILTKYSNHQIYHIMYKTSSMHPKPMMLRKKENSGYAALPLRSSKQRRRDYQYLAQSQIWHHILTITYSFKTATLISPRVISKQCKGILMRYAKRGDWMWHSIRSNFWLFVRMPTIWKLQDSRVSKKKSINLN